MSDELIPIKDSFIVVLDSRNATTYNNSTYLSDVLFNFEDALIFPHRSLRNTCSVLSFVSANSIYNINETNNVLSINYTKYSLPYGNYNSTTFMIALLILLNPSTTTYSISLNSTTNKFTLTNTSSFTINGSYTTIYEVMGLGKNINYGPQTSFTCPYTCNFNGLQSININFKNLTTSNIDSYTKTNSTIIQTINIDSSKSNIQYIRTNEYNFKLNQDIIDYINISITDSLENNINFNNQHWTLTLLFNYIHDVDRFHYNNSFFDIVKK